MTDPTQAAATSPIALPESPGATRAAPAAAFDGRERQPGEIGTLPIRFVGSGSEYFRIWIVNLLLTLVTVGLYYPFAKARRLRYFHGHTEVGGHPLGFHGNPWVMFRGFVLVAGLLVAVQVADLLAPGLGGAVLIVVGALWPLLWRSSLRFRLANTSWRGLRGQFDGSIKGAYFSQWPVLALMVGFLGVALAAGLTSRGPGADDVPPALLVAIALLMILSWLSGPAMMLLMNRYRINHTVYAGERFRFGARFGGFVRVTLQALGLLMLGLLLVGVAVAVVLPLLSPGLGRGPASGAELSPERLMALLPIFILLALGVLVGPLVIQPFLVARLQNLTWSHTRSARLRFHSALKARHLMALRLKNLLLMLVTLGLYFPFAKVAEARMRLEAVMLFHRVPPEDLASEGSRAHREAAGDAAGDLLGFDVGL